jgi:2-oxoglutarate ferredoxin oxidoreductase subunit alpha
MKTKFEPIFSVVVGGQAGDGAKEATINIGRLVAKHGFEFFLSVEYPSLIRGGHNFAQLNFSRGKVRSDMEKLDALVALNLETIEKHKKDIKKDGIILFDTEPDKSPAGVFAIPAAIWAKELGAPPITRAGALLGALCYHFDFKLETLNQIFTEIFGVKAKNNIDLASKGYTYAAEKKMRQKLLPKCKPSTKELFDGNEAFSEGLVAAGLKNYFAYPMTPSSSILHYLAKKARDYKIKVIQPENEISVINMALGSAFAGARTAVASTGGGFALMLEAMALAGSAEIPIVVGDSQRAGTSTGVPTRVGQGDLDFVRHMPGEYPRVVIAPGDAEEAFALAADAMNLTWKYQTPAVVLLDKHLSESIATVELPRKKIKIETPKMSKGGVSYKRHAFTADGVSPLAFPGMKNTVVKTSSYEHDENGWITESPEATKNMTEKRFLKMKGLEREMKQRGGIKILGDAQSKNIVVFYGSVKGAILESMRFTKKSFKAVQIIWLEPFCVEKFLKEIRGAKKLICIDNNFTGQLNKLIAEKTGVLIKNNLRRYDSLGFRPEELAAKFNKLF